MPSLFTQNNGIELPGTGEQTGTWGETLNRDLSIVDRLVSGVGTISLTGTTHTLSTSDGTLSDGMYRVLVFSGSPSGTNTVTLSPNDQQKLYFVRNSSGQSVVLTQGSGGNVTVANGDVKIVYATGTGSNAAVVDLTADFAMSSVSITGGSITGITDLAIADGGTGASDAGTARTNLGLGSIATQASSSVSITGGSITGITDLAIADGGTGASDAGTARTNLGLGSMATQASSSVSITGGSITGITDLAIADGGTGISTVPSNGQLLIGNGSGYTLAGLTGGTGITVTNGAGSITVATTSNLTGSTQSVAPYKTALGVNAGLSTGASATGATAIGYYAGGSITSGAEVTALGYLALSSLTTASRNTAVGSQTLRYYTSGNDSTAVGFFAGESASGSEFVAIGSEAAALGSVGNSVLIGMKAGKSVQCTHSVGIGDRVLGGQYSTANASDGRNVAIGSGALTLLTTARENVAVGANAMGAATTGGQNTAVGRQALPNLTTGTTNTAAGYQTGLSLTTGGSNTLLGAFCNTSASGSAAQIVLGYSATGTADNRVTIGIGANRAELDIDGTDTSWAASSDIRLKTDVQDYAAGLSFLNALRVVSFKWRAKRDVPADLAEHHEDSDDPVHGAPGARYHGFIAQEVRAALDAHPEVVDGQHFWKPRDSGVQTTAPADLVPILVKAVQELSQRVSALESELAQVRGS